MQLPLNPQLTHLAVLLDLDELEPAKLEHTPVIKQARRIARRTRSALTLLCFQSPPNMLSNLRSLVTGEDVERSQAERRQALFDLTRKIQQEDGFSVRCEGQQTAFDPEILADWLAATPTDLLILAKPDSQAAATTRMIGLSRIIRQTGIPVWFADQGSSPHHGVVAAISTGLDGGDGEMKALDYEVMDTARGVSQLFESRLHMVQATERPQPALPAMSMAGLGPAVDGAASYSGFAASARQISVERLKRGKEALKSFVRAAGAAGEVDQLIVGEGDAATFVTARAEALDAGLIIMGATEKSGWETLLKGGTVEDTLSLAPCDVLYVKASDAEHMRPQALLSRSTLEAEPDTSEVDLIVHPRRHFATPLAVLRDETLARRTKVMVLEAWEEELVNEVAHETKMPQQVYEIVFSPEELDGVRHALDRLGASSQAA